MSYEFLEHTADVKFTASGDSLEEVLSSAGEALMATMLDPSTVREGKEVELEAEGDDLEELLFSWLEEVVFLFSAEALVFRKFEVEKVEKTDEGYCARGRGIGERADPGRHRFETEVKAVSYHQMEVKQVDSGWEATVILDV